MTIVDVLYQPKMVFMPNVTRFKINFDLLLTTLLRDGS